jgi:hypothetical protein
VLCVLLTTFRLATVALEQRLVVDQLLNASIERAAHDIGAINASSPAANDALDESKLSLSEGDLDTAHDRHPLRRGLMHPLLGGS